MRDELVTALKRAKLLGLVPIAVVADNAAAYQLGLRLVKEMPGHEHLQMFRCAAHSVQLIVGDILKLPLLAGLQGTVLRILKAFEDADRRDQLHKHQLADSFGPLCLVQPVQTRWNSLFQAASRLLTLRKYVEHIEPQSAADWKLIEDGCRVLGPFAEATDEAQKDATNWAFTFRAIEKCTNFLRELALELS